MAQKAPKTGKLDTTEAVEPGSGGDGPRPRPHGTYPAIVSAAKLDYSKKQNLMIVFEFAIAEGDFAGEKLLDYNVLSGKGAGFTRQTLLAFHDESELNDGFEVNPVQYLGKPVIIAVEKELYTHPEHVNQYREDGKFERSVVKAVLRPDDEAAQSAAQVTLNSEDGDGGGQAGDPPF